MPRTLPLMMRYAVALLVLLVCSSQLVEAQYFGRNKPRYETFDFHVMKTAHFEVHYYPEEEVAVRDAARMLERWYTRLSKLFNHTFAERKPVVLYADQGDFQQTNTTSSEIGEGTGGFTEPLKDRVVLPLTGSYAENDHVIGHELVHLFQFDIAQRFATRGQNGLGYLPLWFIEGMAEYLSLGRNDPNTAMWMRDVVLRNKIPTISDISSDQRYFPYRFGQALWAYIAGTWGDDVVPKLYRSALRGGLDNALRVTLSRDDDKLSAEWATALRAIYSSPMASRAKPTAVGKNLLPIDDETMDIAPSISPDGRLMIFLSSRDLFSTDYYLADVKSGKILEKILSSESSPHLDALRFINNSGSWSADGRKFVTVVYEEGNDRLAIFDLASRDIETTILIPTVGAISNPYYSPDGKEIVFSGSSGGVSDLFIYTIATGKTRRLTQDRYADFQPVWSPDGTTISFVTDRVSGGSDFQDLRYASLGIAQINVTTLQITPLALFPGAKVINPSYTPDGRSLYFIANPDGFSDIYRVLLETGATERITRTATGVSGITGESPAMSVARKTGDVVFSIFSSGGYILAALPPDAPAVGVDEIVSDPTGGILPPRGGRDAIVNPYLADATTGLLRDTAFPVTPYSPTLQLDYIGAPSVGVSVGSNGVALGGATSFYFSDILGYNSLLLGLSLNGSLEDIGGQALYEYSRNRWGWGASIAHFPLRSTATRVGQATVVVDSIVVNARTIEQFEDRLFIDEFALLGKYPFSTTRRGEVSAGYTHYAFSSSLRSQLVFDNRLLRDTTVDLDALPGLNLLKLGTAYVGDNSFFGFTSPVRGERFRAEVDGIVGSLRFGTVLLDYRRYFFVKPVTFAFRGMHYGRYGPDAEDDRLSPLFLGYESNVRGYSADSFDPSECSGNVGCPEFDRLFGSRTVIAGSEVRLPLFGTGGYGLIDFPFLPTEIAAFVDGGVAWSPGNSPSLRFEQNTTDRVPVFSAGFSARMNLFGYFVLELFYARPFQRPNAGWVVGFQLAPGW